MLYEAKEVFVICNDIPPQQKSWVTMPLPLDLPTHWLDLKILRLAHTGADKSLSVSPQSNMLEQLSWYKVEEKNKCKAFLPPFSDRHVRFQTRRTSTGTYYGNSD